MTLLLDVYVLYAKEGIVCEGPKRTFLRSDRVSSPLFYIVGSFLSFTPVHCWRYEFLLRTQARW